MIDQTAIYKILGKMNNEVSLDWETLRKELATEYDFPYSADYLAKMAAGIKLASEAGLIKSQVETVLSDEQKERLKDRVKLNDSMRQVKEVYTAEARSESLRDSIILACSLLEPLPFVEKQSISSKHPYERKLVVTLADVHYGAEWEIKGLVGETINKYSPEIAEARLNEVRELREHIEDIVSKEDISDIIICMLGDSLDGILRQSTTGSKEEGLRVCVSFVKESQLDILQQRIEQFARDYKN